jgi:IclR family acetate operon transcriptional repressor
MEPTQRRARGRPKSAFTESAQTMQALDRALTVLNALSAQERATLTDLAIAVGVPTATTHRILTTLQARGYAEFDAARQTWSVGIEAYRTGAAFLKRTTLADVSRPVLRRLMEATGETANLAIADGGEVVFIGQVETQNPIRAFFHPGTRTPMHASGTGKAILAALGDDAARARLQTAGLPGFTPHTLTSPAGFFADLSETRARGWSFDREERYLGMSCIGAAIRDARGEVVAGVSISGPSNRFEGGMVAEFGRKVAGAADEISAAIGGAPETRA